MSTIGTLAVGIVANTAGFSKGMKQARVEAGLFGKGTDLLKSKVLALGGALAAGFVAKFSFDELKKAADEIDKLAKMADTLGASMEGLGGLGRTAELAGSSADGLGKGMEFMERALAKGSDAFKTLRLDVDLLRRQRPESVFLDIADAMKNVQDAGTRLQLSKDIFGKGGSSLIPTMLQGSDSIRNEMAMQSGFSRADAKVLEEMNDASTRLGQTFKQLEGTMALKFGPAVQRIVDGINHSLGGSTPGDVEPWSKRLGGLTDAEFGKFQTEFSKTNRSMGFGIGGQQNFGGKSATSEADAVTKFFGKDAAKGLGAISSFGPKYSEDVAKQIQEINAIVVAMRARESKMTDDFAKRNASLTFGGMGGLPIGGGMGGFAMGGMGMAIAAGMKGASELLDKKSIEDWNSLAGGQATRLWKTIDNMDVAGNVSQSSIGKKLRAADQVQGNAALEMGSAAAFTQSKLSQQSSQLSELHKKQLSTQQKMEKSLQSIDNNLKNDKPIPTVNIA